MAKKQSNFKKVDTWIDIVKNEHEVLDFWKDADIFNKLRAQNKGGKKWSFLDGPMTANNPMGVHQIRRHNSVDTKCCSIYGKRSEC